MVLVEEFPALTKSEPISFGSTCPRKARAISPFALAGESNRKGFLSPNHSKKRRLKKNQKKVFNTHDDCPDIHSADELAHAFTEAAGAPLRNVRAAQFRSVASIWRQQNSSEHTASSLFRSRFDTIARIDDEGFVDSRTESSSLASMQGTERCFHCDVPSLTALGDYCHNREGAQHSTVPTHVHQSLNHSDSASDTSRSRQDSSSENNSVVFGSPDLPRLWDSSGQESINHITNRLKDIDSVPSTHSNCCTQRTTRCLTSHERTTAGAVGDVDEDDLEGSDLLHLISNSLDRFNEIVHPHELGVTDDSLLLCADSVDLCSSGYGSFDQQPQQLLHSSDKFCFKTSVDDDSNIVTNPDWIDRLNHTSDSQSAPVPYFLAGDCDSSLKGTRTIACSTVPNNSHGVTNRTVPQAIFSNGSSDPVVNTFPGLPSIKPGSISATSDSTGSVTSTADLGASTLRQFGLGTPIPNPPGLSKTHETTQPNIKQSSTDWFELLACAIRALHEGANRTTLKESVIAANSVDDPSKKGILDLDTILNSLTMLGINQSDVNTQWNQENRKPPTSDDFCDRNIALDAIRNVVTQTPVASDGHCGLPSRVHRNTLNSGDLEHLHNQQQQHLSKQNFTGRRSVLSACFPTSSSMNHHPNSWDGANGCNQPVTENNAPTTFRGQHRTNRRHNNSCGSAYPTSLLLPPNRSNATGMTEASFLLSHSSQTAPSLAGRSSATPILPMESKSSNRPIVFHLQEFLRHGNNGIHKRAQYDRPFDFFTGMRSSPHRPCVTTNARSVASSPSNPFGNSSKASSLGSNSTACSSNSSTCGSTNPDQQPHSSEIGANGKPVIAKWRRACSFYLRGHCKKEDCEFAHDLTKVTCKFWEMGECFKGPTCPFLHGYPPELMSQDQ